MQVTKAYIDGMRGIAILMVLAMHTVDHALGMQASSEMGYFLRLAIKGGYGVHLFFIVSAFTLFRSHRERAKGEAFPFRSFYIRRFFRIFPTWWLICLAYAFSIGASPLDTLASMLMYFQFWGNELFTSQWSLLMEEYFYLAFPLFYFATQSKRSAFLFFLFSLLLHFTLPRTILVGSSRIDLPFHYWYCFALGIFLSHFNLERPRHAIFSGLLVLFILLFPAFRPYVIVLVLGGLLILSASPTTLFGKLARNRWVGQFGKQAFSIYLLHLWILDLLPPLTWGSESLSPELRFLFIFPGLAFLNLLLSYPLYRWVELPSIQLGKWVISRQMNQSVKAFYAGG